MLQFMSFAKPVCERLEAAGYWADYIDPCSGLPMIHKCALLLDLYIW